MENGQRKQWIFTLKENDKVYNIAYNDFGHPSEVREFAIRKIMPTGRIRLDNGTLLDENGYKHDEWGIGNISILPMCKKVQDAIKEIKAKNMRLDCIKGLEKIEENNLNYDRLIVIKQQIKAMLLERN
jgi:hypothetical protein